MNLIPRGRRLIGSLALATAMTIVPAVSASAGTWTTSTASASSGCAVTWGSLPKTGSGPTSEPITNLRAGRHTCFDRLVVDLGPAGDGRPDFWVGYVDTWSPHDGSYPQPRGGARISIVVTAPVFANGMPTYQPANPLEAVNVAGYSTFRQVIWAPSEPASSDIGLGVRARLPMRAFVLDGPGAGHRLVIDVAHRW
ncbi:MAG TPA: hypothetical protein VIU11_03120 [Nakamurella sp.]